MLHSVVFEIPEEPRLRCAANEAGNDHCREGAYHESKGEEYCERQQETLEPLPEDNPLIAEQLAPQKQSHRIHEHLQHAPPLT